MPPDPPVSGKLFYKDPALVIGFFLTLLAGVNALVSNGGFADGLSFDEVLSIVLPALAGIGIRFKAYSQETVDKLATRSAQRQVLADKKR
jgi:hypothetical protein